MDVASYSDYPSFTRRWINASKSNRSSELRSNIVVVHDFNDPEGELASEIDSKELSLEDVLRADTPQADILSLTPFIEPVANSFASRRAFVAQAKELLATIEHERFERNCDSEIILVGIGVGILIVKQALLIADREYECIDVRQKISQLGFLGPRDQTSGADPSRPLAIEFALRIDRQFNIGNGLMVGHLCTAISEIDWQFSELWPKYQIVVSPDVNAPWTDTPSKSASDVRQGLSDALRQVRQRRTTDTTLRSQSYYSILSKFSVSHFQHSIRTEPWPIKNSVLKSNSIYSEWVQSDAENSILYLQGPNRSGKSFITNSIFAELRNHHERTLTVLFSFDDFHLPRRSSATFLQALIFQILSTFPRAFKSIQRHAELILRKPTLSGNELLIIIRALLSFVNLSKIMFVIDDADKCHDNIFQYLEDLWKLARGSRAHCKVLVTSCLEPKLSSFWNPNKFILHLGHREQDRFWQHVNRTGLGSEVIDALKSIESPTEARVRLRTLLASPHSGDSLEGAGHILERPLHNLYAQFIGPLETLDAWVLSALSWIAYSFRPLSLGELIMALNAPATPGEENHSIPLTPSEIRVGLSHALGPLIEFRNGKVCFPEPSVADFVRTHLAERSTTCIFPELAILTHAGIARRCLQYLKIYSADSEESTIESRLSPTPDGYSFESYAAVYWPYHFNAADVRSTLVEDVTEFFASGEPRAVWVQRWCAYHNIGQENDAPSTPLTLAAQYGLSEVAHTLLLQDGGEASAPERTTAFETALRFHQLPVARLLSRFTAPSDEALLLIASIGDPDLINFAFHEYSTYPDALLRKCLGTAAFHGYLDAFNSFLDPDREDGKNRKYLLSDDTSILIESVKGGYMHDIEYLLKVQKHPLDHDTAATLLNIAAVAGDQEVFEFLAGKAPGLEDLGENAVTCLYSAIAANSTSLVEALIPRVGPKATDSNGNTPLHIACVEGNSDVFDQLIIKDSTNIEQKNEKGETPIHLASQNGNVYMVEQLLKLGASSTVQNGEQFDALHLAVRGGHLGLVRMLLSRLSEQETSNRADFQFSPSSVFTDARSEGYADTSSSSGESSAHSTERDGEDRKGQVEKEAAESTESESQAGEEESEEEQESYEEESMDSSTTVREYDTEPSPMHSAAKRGYVDIMRELLKLRINHTMGNRFGSTPLHLAAAGGHRAATKLLLEIDSNPNIFDSHGCLPIHRACESGNSLLLMHLIEAGSSTDSPDTSGRVPLHICAEYGGVESIQLLLNAGVDVNSSNYYSGETALHVSARYGHASILEALIHHGGSIELRDKRKQTALHLALLEGHAEASMALLTAGADLSAVTARDQTPLFCAVSSGMNGNIISRILSGYDSIAFFVRKYPCLISEAINAGCRQDVVTLLMNSGWRPFVKDQDGKSPLDAALDMNEYSIAMQLLQPSGQDSPPIEAYSKALVEITLAGFVEGVQRILEYPGVNLEVRGGPYNQTALAIAAESGMVEIVQLLLDHNAYFDSKDLDGYTPVMLALSNGHLEAASLLLDHGADVNATSYAGITMLEFAIRSRKREIVDFALHRGASVAPGLLVKRVSDRDHLIVKTLLFHDCSPFETDNEGRTAIHAALETNDAALLQTLVSYGIMKVDGEQGWTPLHLAAMVGEVESLLAHRAHIQATDHKGWTALHWAASRGHVDAVRTLSDLDAALAAQDNQGMTALHLAAAKGYYEVVRILIQKHTPWDIRDQHKWKAVHYADARGHMEIVSLLVDSHREGKADSDSPIGWDRNYQPSALSVMNDGRDIFIESAIDESLINENLSEYVHIRTEYPIPPKNGVLYYEVEIRQLSKERVMGVGICTKNSPNEGMPGWVTGSVGYHADDGCLFEQSGQGQSFGPQYSTGDTVGCGFDFHQNWIYFTRNGTVVGKRQWETREMLYPVLGFGENGSQISTNFGQDEFIYKDFDRSTWRAMETGS